MTTDVQTQGLCDGDVDDARKSLRSMTRLACGVSSDDEAGDNAPKKGPGRVKSVTSLQQQQQYTVAQSGRKFAVRQLDAKMQNIELGRWLFPVCCAVFPLIHLRSLVL